MALRELAPGVYRDTKTGEIGVDEGELSDFMGDVEDALEGDDDDDDDDDDIEGDDDDGVEGDEIGRLNPKKLARKRALLAKRRGNVNHRLDKRGAHLDRRARKAGLDNHHRQEGHVEWAKTVLAESETLTGAGVASVQIRLQHDFKAEDLTMAGSESGAKVTSIYFADRVVWQTSKGVPASMFAGTSVLRSFLRGQHLRAGLDITVNGSVAAAGDFAVQIVGTKPVGPC